MTATTKMIYCSACDREVAIIVREGQLEGSVCMDIGEHCTGTMCPICAQPPEEILEQVVEIKRRETEAK
jgi:hypothetical protein